MISRLQGILLDVSPPALLVDVQGVGYEVQASMNTIYRLPAMQQSVVLHTQLIVREDAHTLFGFFDHQERQLFRELIKVSGVGPKMALAILSGMEPATFLRSVHQNDIATLTRLPGVGKKTAERLLVEMRDRIKAFDAVDPGAASPQNTDTANVPDQHQVIQEAESALIALGYKPQEASRAVARLEVAGLTSQEVIRQALKNMLT